MTRQSMFTTAVTAIRAQGKPGGRPSPNLPGFSCSYYDPATQTRCAVGHLLPLDEARNLQENSPGAIADISLNALPEDLHDDIDFLSDLQDAHDISAINYPGDDAGFLDSFEERAKIIAETYNLTLP